MIPSQAQQSFCSCGQVATIFGKLVTGQVLTSRGDGKPPEWTEIAKIEICRTCWEREKQAAEEYADNPGFTGFN